MPAERAAWRPGRESSTTVQAKGCSFMLKRRVQEEIGERLSARHLAEELKMRPSKRDHRPVMPSVTRILSRPPELATQVATPAASMASIASTTPGTGLQRRVTKGLQCVGLEPVDEIVRQRAAELALDDLDAGFHRAPHQAAHRLLDLQSRPSRWQRAGEAGVGERLAVDQHAVAIEYDQHAVLGIRTACRPPP